MRGGGCVKCSINKTIIRRLSTTEEFLERVKIIHGDKYDYSQTKYVKADEKLIIICPEHGMFKQSPHQHLKGCGCQKCGSIKLAESLKNTLEEFLERVKIIHGDKYDYSLVEYVNIYTKIKIICKEHGIFEQSPQSHLRGYGCHKCRSSRLENKIRKFLISHNILFEEQKTFSWLKYKNNLFLDFYLPEHKIAIETHGVQHFKICEFFGGDKRFESTQKLDLIKFHKCMENNVKVYYYAEINKSEYFQPVYNDVNILFNKIINNETTRQT